MPGYFGRLPQVRYNPNTSLFAGMSQDQLQTYLASCQQAYIELQSGAKIASVSYAQGDGSRAVTYTQANATGLAALIKQLQQQLGMPGVRRKALRPVF